MSHQQNQPGCLRGRKYPGRINECIHTVPPVYPPIPLSPWQLRHRSPLSAPHRELICRNVCAALCDHSLNTPIILSASASRYHPAVEMTPEGLTVQFSRNGWQLSRQRRREQPASCWLLFISAASPHPPAPTRPLGEGCCWSASRRSALQTAAVPPPIIAAATGPLGRDAATCLCDPVSNPHAHINPSSLHPPPYTYQTNYSSIDASTSSSSSSWSSSSSMHTAEELLIYIFGHDTFQLVVVSPSVCHWYTTLPPKPPPHLFF